MIGIAFQSKSEKVGYIIPVPVIAGFIDDISRGVVDGTSDLGIFWQKIENVAMRSWLKLRSDQSGVLISRVLYRSSSWGTLQEGDVLMKIGDVGISCDGMVPLRGHERVDFTYLLTGKQLTSTIEVEVLRDGEPRTLMLELRRPVAMVAPPQYASHPTYFIFAGLVFMRLTYEYIKFLDWDKVGSRFRYYFYGGELPSPRRTEVVFINQVLADEINVGYHALRSAVVDRVNGRVIANIHDVVEAVLHPQNGYHVVEIDHHGIPGEYAEFCGTRVILDAGDTERATREILERYSIGRDRSDDLIGLSRQQS
jgi:hypothetical protein